MKNLKVTIKTSLSKSELIERLTKLMNSANGNSNKKLTIGGFEVTDDPITGTDPKVLDESIQSS